MRIVVFTCAFGETDAVKAPTLVSPDVRYVALTGPQNAPRVYPYERVVVDCEASVAAERLMSRQVKILADHPALGDADVVLWHDAAFRMDSDPEEVVELALTDNNMVAFKHPDRSQIEDEAERIAHWGMVPLEAMKRQCVTYRGEGFRQKAITSTGFCVRRRNAQIRAFNELWWAEVQRWGWRDQMSVDYSLWRTRVQPAYIEGHYRDNPFARFHKW